MLITDKSTIGEIVARDYRKAAIFESLNIDFCCKGNRTLREVCASRHIDIQQILKELESVMRQGEDSTPDFQSWPLDLLTGYIEKTHHRYVAKQIPLL